MSEKQHLPVPLLHYFKPNVSSRTITSTAQKLLAFRLAGKAVSAISSSLIYLTSREAMNPDE